MNTQTRTVRSRENRQNGQKEKLIADAKTAVSDDENLIKRARSTGAEDYAAVGAELADKNAESIVRVHEIQEVLKIRANYTARPRVAYLHANSWKSMGVVAADGIMRGLILRRG